MPVLAHIAAVTAAFVAALAGPVPSPDPVQDLLSAPFPTALVASPTGAIAWTADSAGRRNIYVALPPDFQPRRVTAYHDDDGQALSALHWLPGDTAIVYVRGGEPNGHGEIPNPALLAQGAEQEVWVVNVRDSTPHLVGHGGNPAVSSTGRIALLEKDHIRIGDQDLHTRGTASTLRWSPDGAHLAFVSTRGDHAFIGVYDVGASTLRYLAPNVDTDQDPIWSPDSRRVAFIRLPARTRVEVFGAHRTGRPWSIWVADAASGTGHAAWTADTGVGSVFHDLDDPEEIGPPNLFWANGDILVFPWERDGWLHLYRVSAAGGTATLLTPGAFEVGQATLTPDRSAILWSGNAGDIDRRHIWRTPIDGATTQLTTGTGLEWAPIALNQDGSRVALVRSDATSPARVAILSPDDPPRDLTSAPTLGTVTPQPVTFHAADGLLIHGQLFLPSTAGRHPALIFVHGGSRREMLLGFNYMQYYSNAYGLNAYLASRGYVVLAVNYRSGIGYGMPFREALHYGATGASEYQDVVAANRYLRRRADVDSLRIGIWGGSYGGYLTALALARNSNLFAAGVDFHGVHDWNLEFDTLVPGWDIARDQAARHLAFSSSPMASVSHWRSPVLLIQGDDDRNVNFSQTVQLTEDLRTQGVHVETLIFPDEIHGFLRYASWLAAYHATVDFFDRTLTPHM
jgi:dipeptidyl aminopeptidase/acylaminoacyl peptidase